MSKQHSTAVIVSFGGFEVDISQFNLEDHSSNALAVKISSIVFISSVVLVVALRTFARIKYAHNLFADDGTLRSMVSFTC